MQILGLLGAAAFSLDGAVVGIRRLRLAARTRQAPELAMGIAAFGWNVFEGFSLHRQLRRRLALGLAEPEIANRVLLWGIGAFAAFTMTLHAVAARIFVGQILGDGHRLVSSGLGLIAAVAIGLAFFRPAAYRRRFAAPAEQDRSR